jgi:hypothetical protein
MRPHHVPRLPWHAGQFLDGLELLCASASSRSWPHSPRSQSACRDRRLQGEARRRPLSCADSRTVDLSGHGYCLTNAVESPSACSHWDGIPLRYGGLYTGHVPPITSLFSRVGKGLRRNASITMRRPKSAVRSTAALAGKTRRAWSIISLWFFVAGPAPRWTWAKHRHYDVFLQNPDHIIVLSDSRARVQLWGDSVP